MDASDAAMPVPALLPSTPVPGAPGPAAVTLGAELRGTALLFGMAVGATGGVAALAHLLLGLLH